MSNKIQMVAGWLSQFIILNVLWFIFTVLGLGVLGSCLRLLRYLVSRVT
ncbi:hypothetical protein [Halolactibacillus sp. JCM 19043]|nr:hypothetical protein [Halolactibacillus sp. JCM 19043]